MVLSKIVNTCTWKKYSVMISFYLTISAFVLVRTSAENLVSVPSDSQMKDLLMRGAKPKNHDAYLCTAYTVPDQEAYIYKFETLANASTAHHILMYGCDGEPFSRKLIWRCEEICQSGRSTILYAWGKNAPPVILPKGVGVRIGQQTTVKTIVLQTHYGSSFGDDEPSDHSGVRIYTTHEKQTYVAGIFLLASNYFTIPPGFPSFSVDISCRFAQEKSIFPIFFRTHTHDLGTVVAGYQYNDSFHEIGKGNPQWPQAFYPVKDKIEIKQGDYLAARCTYDSTSKDQSVSIGATRSDEMCNFYMMFYTDSSVEDPYGECTSNMEPELTGKNLPSDASVILPPNPALEEKAKGHDHHAGLIGVVEEVIGHEATDEVKEESKGLNRHGGMSGMEEEINEQNRNGALKTEVVDKSDIGILNVGTQQFKDKILQSKMSSQGDQAQGNTYAIKLSTGIPGKSGEIIQYDYDFDDLDSMGQPYQKRQQHEYYGDYAANDLREKGMFEPSTGGAVEQGLSRNRNKEFETMNQQLQRFPHKKQPYRPPHQQLSNPAGIGGMNSNSRRPLPVEHGPQVADTNQVGVEAAAGIVAKAHSQIHFQHGLEYNASWPIQKIELGQIGGVATDNDGNVYIFHRASRAWTAQLFSLDNDFLYQDSPIAEDVVVILDSQGRLIRKFGAGQYFLPHGIEVDKSGNIWLTDVAMHQVFKIDKGQSKPSLTLGQKFKHGKGVSFFCQPTDVAVLSSGEFFVSDGYCNGRVLKFSKDGTLLKMWGERNAVTGNSPPAGTFDIPHSITVSEESQLVCVADRENGRVQCFDLDGNIKHIIKHPQFGPRLFAIEHCPLHGGILYAVNGPAYSGPRDFSVQGFTLDIKTGSLLEVWNLPQLLKNPHDVCVHPASQSVYVGELDPVAVWKFSRASSTASKPMEKPGVTPKHVDTLGETKLNGTTMLPHTPVDRTSSAAVSNDTSIVVQGMKDTTDGDITPSVVIGCLLVIPVILLLAITILVRAHKSGKLKCYHRKNRVFSLQGILGNSHKGFDALSTEDSDHDLDQDDSDREEFLTPKKIKSKA